MRDLIALASAALLVPSLSLAQAGSSTGGPDSSAKAIAVRADQAPLIDGREDDAVWRQVQPTSDFREFQPAEGKTPRFKTEFKAAYDERNLYVFIRAFDPHPDSIMHALSRRDERGPSDQLKVMVDSYFDRRNGYEFSVNPDGVKRDYAMYNDREEDPSWDAVWDVGTRVDSAGWTAEFRIPLSQMRYNKAARTFGIAIWRDIERYKERTAWPMYSSARSGLVSQLGRLEGLDGLSTPQRLEVTPYTVTKNISRTKPLPAGTSYDRVQLASAGADIKYGIGPNITLDATVNPDFGQVEADPSVLNLSSFETFFREKRPFFLEGVGLYNFSVNCSQVNCGGEGLFYSRRIGRRPQLDFYGDFGSATATPILGAGKLTGRLASGFSLGALEAVTGRVSGTQDRTMEPQTSYTVVRAQQEFLGGGTTVGVIGTGVRRSLDSWSDTYLRRNAYVGGADVRHKFHEGIYEVSASYMMSRVAGDATVMALTQTDGVHNYQRPDAGLPYDPTRTSLSGNAEEFKLAKAGGGKTRFETSYMRRSPGFEINDLGYLRRADEQAFQTWFGLQYRQPNKFWRLAFFNFNYWNMWTVSDGLPTEAGLNTNWHVNLPNNSWVHFGGTVNALPGTLCDRCARGGPAVARSTAFNYWGGYNWDDRQRVAPSLFMNWGSSDLGNSQYVNLSPGVDIKASSAVQMSVGFDVTTQDDDQQFYGSFSDVVGTHYMFAHLKQKTIGFNTRTSYTITPLLSLQVYAQPFITKGDFSSIRELSATPRARDYYARYQPFTPPAGSDPGFNFKQMRSNVVLRWEYRPASTMFVVWTHGREFFDTKAGTRTWREEYDDLFAQHPDNTFLVKVAYWLSR